MDIKKKIEELVESITANKALLTKFKADPVATVKSLLDGMDLDKEMLEKLAAGVKAKIDLDKVDDLVDGLKDGVDLEDAKSIAGALGGLFGKK